ncbi:MAG: XdhC family protein [Bacteroidota bacterium]
MKEFFPQIKEWVANKKKFYLATVIKTWGSSPRPIGSVMLVGEDLTMIGSVSGGCVETSVVRAVQNFTGSAPQKLSFGIEDEMAWSVGLSCGGKVEVLLEPFLAFSEEEEEKKVWEKIQHSFENDRSFVLATALEGEGQRHFFIESSAEDSVVPEALKKMAQTILDQKQNQVVSLEGKEYFFQIFSRRPQLIIVGAAHVGADLVTLAKLYDFETIVIDPRQVFTEKTNFKNPPDQMIAEYPADVLSNFTLDQQTYLVVLSHDPKIDDDALQMALRSNVAYIGALGSKRTHQKRVKRLIEAGFSESEIDRIHAPIGINLGGRKANEIALSIMAEIIKVKNTPVVV